MKSLNFTVLKEKLLDGSKTQTIRCTFIPKFKEGEIINIKFKKEILFQAEVLEIYPKQVKYLNYEEAVKDGFYEAPLPKQALKNALKQLNPSLKEYHWCFIIRFQKEVEK